MSYRSDYSLRPRRSILRQLSIGGCDVADLAAEFGTPLFVYDEAHLRSRCREAVAAFPDGVAYATKAFCAGRWPGSPTTRASCSMWQPVARSTPRWRPASRPIGSFSTGTTSRPMS